MSNFSGKWSLNEYNLAVATGSWVGNSFDAFYATGLNDYEGLLSIWFDDQPREMLAPALVSSEITHGTKFAYKEMALGENDSFVITQDKKLYGQGANANGELGQGNRTESSFPLQIGEGNFEQVASSQFTVGAVDSTGSLYMWGQGLTHGNIGDGFAVSRSTPVQIPGEWSQVRPLLSQTYAIKPNGDLYGWGQSNSTFPLGDNALFSRSSPVQIGAGITWAQIHGYVYHVLALDTSGNLYVWGRCTSGASGLNVATAVLSSPVQIGSDTWISVGAGDMFSAAVRSDGTLWTWGEGDRGQTGQNTTTDISSPTQVGSDTDWIDVTCGEDHVVAVKSNGEAYAWGLGTAGQLGDGGDTNRSSPVQLGGVIGGSKAIAGAIMTAVKCNIRRGIDI